MRNKEFLGAIALITGGASGIGRAISAALCHAGARVFVADRSMDSARRACEELGHQAQPLALDVSRSDAWAAAVAAVAADRGDFDILVNNAGVVLLEPVDTMSLDQWCNVMDTNLNGAFYGMSIAASSIKRGGAILNIASTAGLRGNAFASAYAASKAGVISLTRSAARQFADEAIGIRVNAICPGPIKTPAHDQRPGSTAKALGAEAIREKIVSSVPMNRLGAPEEVAAAALFLVGQAASFITGAILTVDGGQTA